MVGAGTCVQGALSSDAGGRAAIGALQKHEDGKLVSATLNRVADLAEIAADAVQLDPNDVKAYYSNRGVNYSRLGQHQRAIQDYNQAIRLKPTAWLYNERGYAYYNLGQVEKADTDKAKACSLDNIYC